MAYELLINKVGVDTECGTAAKWLFKLEYRTAYRKAVQEKRDEARFRSSQRKELEDERCGKRLSMA